MRSAQAACSPARLRGRTAAILKDGFGHRRHRGVADRFPDQRESTPDERKPGRRTTPAYLNVYTFMRERSPRMEKALAPHRTSAGASNPFYCVVRGRFVPSVKVAVLHEAGSKRFSQRRR